MKKIWALLLVLFVAVTLFAACGEKKDDTGKAPENTAETVAENKNENNPEKTPENTETPVNPNAKMFESKFISFELPEGYVAKEDAATINVTNEKDPLKAVIVTVLEGNPAPIEEVAKQTMEMLKGSTQENVKIGNYDYIKLSTPLMGINVTTLMLSQNGNIFSMTVKGFDDANIQKLLASITLK